MLNRLRDVFESLNDHEVRYLVIGGIAAVLHGVPRATFDLDVLIDATPENARRLLEALARAGLRTPSSRRRKTSSHTRSRYSRTGFESTFSDRRRASISPTDGAGASR